MISISKLSALLEDIRTNVSGIKQKFLCVHEGHAFSKLKDESGVNLLCIYPSSNRIGSINEATDQDVTWLFLLEKDVEGQTNPQEEAQMEKLQEKIIQIRDFIEEAASTTHCYLQRIDTSKSQIIPEYREFGGWNGWSLSLVF